MDWNTVAAISSAIAAVAAAGALVFGLITWKTQTRLQRFHESIDHVANLEDRYNSPEMHKTVQEAAKFLITCHDPQSSTSSASEEHQLAEEDLPPALVSTLNFLQFVAFLTVRKRLLDRELVWNNFYQRMNTFWQMSQPCIKAFREQQRNKAIWGHIEECLEQLEEFQEEEYRRQKWGVPQPLTPDDLVYRLYRYAGKDSLA